MHLPRVQHNFTRRDDFDHLKDRITEKLFIRSKKQHHESLPEATGARRDDCDAPGQHRSLLALHRRYSRHSSRTSLVTHSGGAHAVLTPLRAHAAPSRRCSTLPTLHTRATPRKRPRTRGGPAHAAGAARKMIMH